MQQNPWQVEQFRSIILLSTIITTLFQEQSGFVTEALRHLHAAQLAAADESRQTARQLSEQQQQALEKLTVAQAAANKVPIKSFSHKLSIAWDILSSRLMLLPPLLWPMFTRFDNRTDISLLFILFNKRLEWYLWEWRG